MVCSRCGNECNDSKYCPNCGKKLYSGSENSLEVAGLVSFIVTVSICGIKLIYSLLTRGSVYWLTGSYRFYMPFRYVSWGFAALMALIIVFSALYRGTKLKGFGITALVLASVAKVCCIFNFGTLLILAGTIVHFISINRREQQ